MFKKIYRFFDKFEDVNRMKLSHSPIVYAFLTGAGIILFWRGIWHAADETPFLQDSYVSIVIGAILLLAIGTFISSFIGNEIIISGNKKEEKLVYKIAESEKLDLENEFEGGEK
ncbi:MAG: hypothetical protein M1155_02310, partial [Patescibacteria group bacterium]|nr:hypothetical protein [Patescibacteria group bacterium]